GLRYDNSACMSAGCNLRWRGARRYEIDVYRKDGDVFAVNSVAAIPALAPAGAVLTDPAGVSTACAAGSTAMCTLALTSVGTVESGKRELVSSRFDLVADHPMLDIGYLAAPGDRTVVMRGGLDFGAPRFLPF